MKHSRALAAPLGLCAAAGIAGCFTVPHPKTPPVPAAPVSSSPPAAPPPLIPQAVPDAVPRIEPRSRYGNPPYYEVFGKRYFVLSTSVAYVERGVASWYGPGFHQVLTSTREPYDMYAMTAAHKTLPLPAYVRVTNLQNGRSIVVRVNDRGPFVGNRIIDLSYTAAAKLDMLRNGTAMVEVRAIDPSAPTEATVATSAAVPVPVPSVASTTAASAAIPVSAPSTPAALYIQAGAFADPANAEHLAAQLRGGNYGTIFVRDDVIAGRKLYRVRIGPVPNVPEFDRIVGALERAGVHDAHLALN
jgi:rare lipoprotein A